MSWVENLRLRNKLLAVLALPVLGLLILSSLLLLGEYRAQQELAQLAQAGRMAIAVTALAHELQNERGRSGVLLAQGDGVRAEELIAQRQASDRNWGELERLLNQSQVRMDDVLTPSLLETARSDLLRLRQAVDRHSIDAGKAVTGYSDINLRLLNALQALAQHSRHAELAGMLSGFFNLAAAKESAGLERVEGSRLLLQVAAGASPELGRLRDLGVEQRVQLNIFQNQAPKGIASFFLERMNADCNRRFEQLRADVAQQTPRLPSAGEWFDTASCRIERLREVELHYARLIGESVESLLQAGRQRTLWLLLLTLLPVLPSLFLIVRVTRNVSGSTRWLLNAMHGIAGGNFNVSLPPQSQDELGELSAGLNRLRTQLAVLVSDQGRHLEQERETNRRIARRSAEISAFALAVSAGDLRERLDERDPTLMQLSQVLNRMVEGLSSLARNVREHGLSLAGTVARAQSTVGALASGASQQAAAVNETTATLEEIRATSSQTLEKAVLLGEVAERARAEGERGRRAVQESISGMDSVHLKVEAIGTTILELNEWTQRIGEITSVVNDIARQLRLISLNAAIEASKAGEAGKGFSVVAGEVKQLAEQSQSATEQVQRILEEIRHATDRTVMAAEEGNKGVARGQALVQRAGDVIHSLESVVGDTLIASRQIVAAVRQEATGIVQIATAVSEIQSVTTQFVRASDHSRDLVRDLGHLVQELEAAVRSYRL